MKICKKCGTPNHPDEIFCTNCGENLMRKDYLDPDDAEKNPAESEPEAKTSESEAPENEPPVQEKAQAAAEDDNSLKKNNEDEKPKKKRSKKPLIITLIIVGILAIAAALVAGYFYFIWIPDKPTEKIIVRDLKADETVSRQKVGSNEYEFDIKKAVISNKKINNKQFTFDAKITRESEIYGISPETYAVKYVKSGTKFEYSKAVPRDDDMKFYAVKGVEIEIATKKAQKFYKDAVFKQQITDLDKGVDRVYFTVNNKMYEGMIAVRYDFSDKEGWKYKRFSDKKLEIKKGITHEQNGLLTNANIKNILFLGVDSDSGAGRSDCMMLISVDANTGKIKQTSFMRDNWFDIPGYGKNKLNAAYAFGGAALTIKTIQNTFGIKINKYISVDFSTFKEVIENLGGVDVNITADEAGYINWQINKNGQTSVGLVSTSGGVTHLNGQQALWLCRDRGGNGFGGDDFTRSARQRRVIRSLVGTYKNYTPSKVLSTIRILRKKVKTNLTGNDFKWLAANSTRFFGFKFEERCVPQAGEWQAGTSAGGAWIIQLYNFPKLRTDVRHFIYEDYKGN